MPTPPLFLLEVGSLSSLSLLSSISSTVPHFESRESFTSQISGAYWRAPPTSYLWRLPVSILSAGPQVFSPFLSPNIRSGSNAPFSPVYFPSQVSPSPLVIAFLSFSSGTEASSLGHFSLLIFLSSVDCILYILYFFWLIPTY